LHKMLSVPGTNKKDRLLCRAFYPEYS